MRDQPTPPHPASLAHLRPTDIEGVGIAGAALALTAAGALLSSRPSLAAWIAGQLLLTIAFVHWFVLLHESGHGTLCRTRRWNVAIGSIAGVLTMIPFQCWKRVHDRHHKWTGWQDVDPTTAALVPRTLSRLERILVNIAWRFWIPLFATLYRVNNFWNVPRLWRLFPSPIVRRRLLIDLSVTAVLYTAAIVVIGPLQLLRILGVPILLSFIVEDVLLLSQHTHVPMGLSHGQVVDPHPAMAQEVFTRSMRLPDWASRALLRFDAHELHHMYPFVPGYRLDEIPYQAANEVSWRRWVPAARAVPGEIFLFQNRDDSGFDI